MSRYKDIDKLLTDEMTHTLPIGCGRSSGRVVVFVEDIENAPTADVVPRDEVQEIFKEFDRMLERYAYEPYYTVQDMEIEANILKEKYTKGGAKDE